MTTNLEKIPNEIGRGLVVAAFLLFNAAFAQGVSAASDQKADETYQWSAELVSFDPASKTVTLESMIEPYAEIKNLDALAEGDPVKLVWTGMTWGAGIRDVVRGQDASAPADALVLPAEFVGTETEGHYIVYRVPVPAASVSDVQALKPGDWVTAISPKHSSAPDKAVLEMHAYTDVG